MLPAWLRPFSCLVILTAGCESVRPEGSYTGRPGIGSTDPGAGIAPDSDEDIYGDDVDTGEDADPSLRDGTAAESPLIGDYWMLSVAHVKLAATQLGVTIKTTTETRSYSLVTVRTKGDGLELRDWQCTARAIQSCQSGCTKMSTTLRDAATSSKAFIAPRRVLTVTNDHWSVSPVAYAIGFKGDYASSPDMELPSVESDPLLYDPDGGGKGVDFSTSVTASGFTVGCNLRVAQKVAIQYEGELGKDGELAGGSLVDFGSTQTEISNSCSGTATEPTPGDEANTVRFIRAPKTIDTSKMPWACPSLEEFEAELGD